MIKGADEVISLLEQWQSIIENANITPIKVMLDSQRLASSKTQIDERGSIAHRLGRTDKEAEIINRAEDIRLGRESEDSPHEDIDDAAIERIIDDMIDKTILQGM